METELCPILYNDSIKEMGVNPLLMKPTQPSNEDKSDSIKVTGSLSSKRKGRKN